MKQKTKKLEAIFAELGMPAIGEPLSLDDAQMIAEDEGSGIIYDAHEHSLPQCDGKVCYPSQSKAERVKKRRMQISNLTHLCSYLCPKCKAWHLTSTKR